MAARPGTGDDPITFQGSNGLWITLAILAALILVMTIWIAVGSVVNDGTAALPGILLKGGAGAALLALGAWFMARERREVILDGAGVTIRAGDGSVRASVPWQEIDGIEERRLPSQPLQPAVILHRADGSALMIDPQQVRDTGALAREAARRLAQTEGGKRQAEFLKQRRR